LISEHQLAVNYPSLWSTVTPLSDGYWLMQNRLTERVFTPPLKPFAPTEFRAVINEVAYRAFLEFHRLRLDQDDRASIQQLIRSLTLDVINYVNRLSGSKKSLEANAFDSACMREAMALTFRHLHFFPNDDTIELSPAFHGCGSVSACFGDVISEGCLYEIKAGDRGFRIADLRQLLIYSALAHASKQLRFQNIALLNPRTGQFWKKSLNDVCLSIAGQSSIDTLDELVKKIIDLQQVDF